MTQEIQTQLEAGGILLATIDMPGRRMNVFSEALMNALEALLDRVAEDSQVRGVIITSGKPAFLAGADLDMISMFADRAEVDERDDLVALYGRLSGLFRRLELSTKPYVAALNGLALGGGLELAMACHGRVLVDEPGAVLGLPEVKLGLLPGAGGTQRLPALVGLVQGLRMLLTGDPVAPAEAVKLGLVDELTTSDDMMDCARIRLNEMRAAPAANERVHGGDSAPYDFSADNSVDQIAQHIGLNDEQLADYPAHKAIIDCVVGGWPLDWDAAFAHEIQVFTTLMLNPVAGNMVRGLFLNRQRAVKQGRKSDGCSLVILAELPEKQRTRLQAKANVIEPADAGDNDIVIISPGQQFPSGRHVCVQALDGVAECADDAAQLYLAAKGEHGQAAEVHVAGGDPGTLDAGLVVATLLGACPLVTEGAQALLPELARARRAVAGESRDRQMLAVALTAARAIEAGTIVDPALADVATVLSGLMPAFSGGALTYLRQRTSTDMQQEVAAIDGSLAPWFELPQNLDKSVSTPVSA